MKYEILAFIHLPEGIDEYELTQELGHDLRNADKRVLEDRNSGEFMIVEQVDE